MKFPLKFDRMYAYKELEAKGGRKFAEHEGYPRENSGDWIILDADGHGCIVVKFQGTAKRGQGWNAPDPEGMKIARMIVEAMNERHSRDGDEGNGR